MKTTMRMGSSRTVAGIWAIAACTALAACGDDSETTSGTGGAGGAGTTSSQASSGSPASTSQASSGSPASTSSAGPGGGEGGSGEGGAGGEGGSGDGGAGGGRPGACFAADDFADLFALETDELCVVARHDAAGFFVSSYGNQPTWGTHGGPLTGEYLADVEGGPITAVQVTRWSVPIDVEGALAADTVEVDLTNLIGDDASFGGAQIVDVEEGLSAFSYTGADFANEGGLVYFDDAGAVEVDLLLGGFGLGVAAHDGSMLYTALAPLFDTELGAAGFFGSVPCDEGGILCGGFSYAAWGDATGAVAVDDHGNAFAVNTSFDGTQMALAFGAAEIAAGEPTAGNDLFLIDGFGTPLAAVAPEGDAPGLLVYQPTDGGTFLPVPAIVAPYVEQGDAVVSGGEAALLLTPAAEGAAVSLVGDGEGRIWVGVATDEGTTFAVLARP